MHKLKMIFFVFIFCICLSNVAYADETDTYSFPDFKHLISDSSGKDKYYSIVVFDPKYISWVSNTTYTLYVYDSLTDVPYANGQRNGIGYVYDLTATNSLCRDISWKKYDYTIGTHNDWVFDSGTQQLAVFGGGEGCLYNTNGVENIYSNFDITDSTGKICFFQQAPTISGALVPTQKQTMSLMLGYLRYLVPCLIVLVVFLISFHKAWNWLKMQL